MIELSNSNLMSIALESTRDGMMVTDQHNKIVYVNRAFSEVTGYDAEEVLGKSPNILKSDKHEPDFYRQMWNCIVKDNQWHGKIWDRRKNGEVYLELLTITTVRNNLGEITHFVGVFTDINAMQSAEEKIRRISLYDSLTQLPNRSQLLSKLQTLTKHSSKEKKLLAVIMLDLDDFKIINDRYGHQLGDRLLIRLAERLNSLVNDDGVVSRLSGDEFTLVLGNIGSVDELEYHANRILDTVSRSIDVDGKHHHVTASLGITIYPFDNADPETLLRHADQAMFKAKEKGSNCYHLFDTVQDRETQTRKQLLNRLAAGLGDNELMLYYQPKVNLRTGEVVGAEALLRWDHPEEGILPPNSYLPHVEHHDLIVEIGQWVIDRACQQITEWSKMGIKLPVSVNVAARQLLRGDFVDSIKACLERYPDLPRNMLEIEILESAALENTQYVHRVIDICHEFGISFALDDFGTGYASLSYLRDIPADTLKIDQTFVRDILDDANDLTLVEGIVGLATAFTKTVIAEGVENSEQGVLLLRMGCDIAQGFGIAKPMHANLIPDWIAAYQPDPQWALWADTAWEMNDFPLLVAQYDHIRWVRRILLHIDGARLGIPISELGDHHHCRFGHWYYGHGSRRYGHLKEFSELEKIHIQVHKIGKAIVNNLKNNQPEAAQKLVPQLMSYKDQILQKLVLLQHCVAKKPRLVNE